MFVATLLIGAIALGVAPFFSEARANEGEYKLRNVTGASARCMAYSVLMQDRRFSVLMSCRDIVYPAGTDVFNYVVWAEAPDGDLERLGTLGFGKVEFRTNKPFNALFVTQEKSERPRNPGGPVQMRGSFGQIEFLYGPQGQGDTGNNLNLPTDLAPTESPAPAKTSSISRTIATGGVVGFVLLFLVIALLFVISRK